MKKEGARRLPVSFHFECSPCIDVAFLEAALDGVGLADRRSYEAQFSVMGEMQVGAPFLRKLSKYLQWRKGKGGVVDHNSDFCAVKGRLIKYSIIKLYEYIQILTEAG